VVDFSTATHDEAETLHGGLELIIPKYIKWADNYMALGKEDHAIVYLERVMVAEEMMRELVERMRETVGEDNQ